MKPTPEQERAISMAAKMQSLSIEAKAGAGKTATLIMIADALPARGQYLVFNKAMAEEIQARLPSSGRVAASTFHSLAYRTTGKAFRSQLGLRLNGGEVASMLRLSNIAMGDLSMTGSAQGYVLIEAVRRFCRTLDPSPTLDHMPRLQIAGLDERAERAIMADLLPHAVRLWDLMRTPGRKRPDNAGPVPISHDVYLKLWADASPTIHGDYIMMDEAQDMDPLMISVLSRQPVPVIYVGDPFQQLYSFRGAVDAMTKVSTPNRASLNTSFRFGPEIAAEANKVLKWLGCAEPVIGFDQIRSQVGIAEQPSAILCRTNAAVVKQLMHHVKIMPGRDIAATGVNAAKAFFESVISLKQGKRVGGELQLFKAYDDVIEFSESESGGDLAPLVRLERDYGAEEILRTLSGVLDASRGSQGAKLVLSTAHRAKGQQYDSVKLDADFKVPGQDKDKQPTAEDMRLLYVAMTRAKRLLDVSSLDISGLEDAAPEFSERLSLCEKSTILNVTLDGEPAIFGSAVGPEATIIGVKTRKRKTIPWATALSAASAGQVNF